MSRPEAADVAASLHLLCDCLSVAPRPERAEELRHRIAGGQVNWDCPLRLAGAHLVTPSLAGALRRKGVLELLEDDVRGYLETIESLNRTRNSTLWQELVRASGALNAIGIKPLLLKGALALTPGQYPGAYDRVIGDIDLVVPFERTQEAQREMVRLGYREATEHWRRMTSASKRAMHHFVPLVHPVLPVSIEIHHRIMHDVRYDAALRTIFTPRTIRLPEGPEVLIPDSAGRMLHNFLHAQINDGLAARRLANLRQVLEFSSLAAQCDVDPERIKAAAGRENISRLAHYWSLAEAWFGAPYPAKLGRSPAERRELWLTERVATRRSWRRASYFYGFALKLPRRLKSVFTRVIEFTSPE